MKRLYVIVKLRDPDVARAPGRFNGAASHQLEKITDVQETHLGSLVIKALGFDGNTEWVLYPRGEWIKARIVERDLGEDPR